MGELRAVHAPAGTRHTRPGRGLTGPGGVQFARMSSQPGTHTLTADGVEAELADESPRIVTRAGALQVLLPAFGRARKSRRPLTRQEKIVRGVGIGLLLCATLAGVAVIAGYFLTKMTPSWFRPQNPQDPLVMAAARRVENSIATVLTRVRKPDGLAANQPASIGPDRWAIALSAEDANAWLSARLPRWMETECDPPLAWPREVGAVQVAFENGKIYVGANLASSDPSRPNAGRVLTATIEPVFDEDGALWTPARTIGMGRMGVPAGLILSAAAPAPSREREGKSQQPSGAPDQIVDMPQTRGVFNALAGNEPTLRTPVLKIGDGRRVRLIDINPRDGRLIVTFETITR